MCIKLLQWVYSWDLGQLSWYRHATSVPFDHLSIDLSPRTDDRLGYCTRSGNNPSNFYVPDNLKHLKHLDDEHTKFLYSSGIPTLFPRMKNSVSKNLSEGIIRFLSKCIVNLLQGNLSEVIKVTCQSTETKFTNCLEEEQLGHNEEVYFRRKKDYCPHKKFPPSSLVICLEMEQFVLVPLSVYNSNNNPTIVTKQELPIYKPEQSPTYQKDTIKKEINQSVTTSATPLLNKKLESSRIKLSNSNKLILHGIETGLMLKDFAQRLKRKNVPIPDIYFIFLDAASITPDLVDNSHAKGKERGAWIPFKI